MGFRGQPVGAGAHPSLAVHDALGLATDAEVTTHKTSTDHDGRYYTETEVDAAFSLLTHTHTNKFERGADVLDPTAPLNIISWRAPYACTVLNVRGYRVGGIGATINARKNGSVTEHLASDLSLTSADVWIDGGAVTDTAYAAGDKLEVMIISVAGAPTQLAIQVDYERTL